MTTTGHSNRDWRSALARSGLIAKGVFYAALGLLAVKVASGDGTTESVSRRGAIELVASQPVGQWLVGILTAGLFALAIWHVVQALTGDPVEGDEPTDRLKFAGKAGVYLMVGVTALTTLLARWGSTEQLSGTGAGRSSADQATSTIMSSPAGPWIVGVGGAVIIAVAVYEFQKHVWKTAFMDRLDRAMGSDLRRSIQRAGQSGYAARAIVAAIVGVFLIVAAVQHDAQEAVGLSGALGALRQQTFGQAMLWIVSIGLLLYGMFCFAEAKYRRAT